MTPLETFRLSLPGKSREQLEKLREAHKHGLGGQAPKGVEAQVLIDFQNAIREELRVRDGNADR